jgi:hypothetical protein
MNYSKRNVSIPKQSANLKLRRKIVHNFFFLLVEFPFFSLLVLCMEIVEIRNAKEIDGSSQM